MKFQLLVILLVFCSVLSASISPFLMEQIDLIEAELETARSTFPILIRLFYSLKLFYKRFEYILLESYSDSEADVPPHSVKLYSVLSKYFTLIVCFYNNSPLESLRSVRLYGNFEFAFLFIFYIKFKRASPHLSTLENPFQKILLYKKMRDRFGKYKFPILDFYYSTSKDILNEPFGMPSQVQQDKPEDQKMATQTISYDPVHDWEEKRQILEEIILSIQSLKIFARHLTVDVSDFLTSINNKTEKFKFVLKNFLVDSQGPSFAHFLSIFHQIQNIVQNAYLYRELPTTTKKLLFLFDIYRHHFVGNPLIDPRHFPKRMLAITAHPYLWKLKIFKFFTLQTTDLVQKSVKSLRKGKVSNFFKGKRGKLIAEICNIETNSQDAVLNISKGLWLNLLDHREILSPRKRWYLEAYLALQNKG
jgi:hypothetical protein